MTNISNELFTNLMSAINESLAIDGEFCYSVPIDGDEKYRRKIFEIKRLDDASLNYATNFNTHVDFTMYEQFYEQILNTDIEVKIKYAFKYMHIFVKGVHALRSELIYINPTMPEKLCKRCQEPFRGPSLYCSLDCTILDAIVQSTPG